MLRSCHKEYECTMGEQILSFVIRLLLPVSVAPTDILRAYILRFLTNELKFVII